MTETARVSRSGATDERRVGEPFELREGPLLRAKVLRLGADEHVLLLTMHHIISDGWSMGVLIRRVVRLYEGYSRGGEAELEELEIQYADYAQWQREWLQGEVLERAAGVLARAVEGSAGSVGAADGPSAAGGAEFARSDADGGAERGG